MDMQATCENRYRFTLAHELGHRELHKDVYLGRKFDTTDEWKEFQQSMPDIIYGRMEWQAYEFGGLLLVPTDPLKQVCDDVRASVLKEVKNSGLEVESGAVDDLIIGQVANAFSVSKEVIRYRFKAEAKKAKKPS